MLLRIFLIRGVIVLKKFSNRVSLRNSWNICFVNWVENLIQIYIETWDQVFTIDKRLIGGRSQFVSQALKNDNQVKKIEKKKLHIIQREISFPGYKNPVTFTVSGDTEEYQENIKKFNNTLQTILIALGVGLMFAVFLQVNFG